MLIDWFTVGAQALNFLLLIWLLKRFLYKPVLDAIDAREKKIAARIADAEQREKQAQQEQADFQRKNAAIDQQRADLLRKVAEEAEVERTNLMEAAKKAADALSTQRNEALRNESRDLASAIQRRTRGEVFAITRSTLKDLASADLEERMCHVLIGRLQAMDEKTKALLTAALRSTAEAPQVRSAFELPETERTALQQAVNKTFGTQAALEFTTAPDLVAGIELSANGQKIAWSIADHLGWLESSVEELIRRSGSDAGAPIPAKAP